MVCDEPGLVGGEGLVEGGGVVFIVGGEECGVVLDGGLDFVGTHGFHEAGSDGAPIVAGVVGVGGGDNEWVAGLGKGFVAAEELNDFLEVFFVVFFFGLALLEGEEAGFYLGLEEFEFADEIGGVLWAEGVFESEIEADGEVEFGDAFFVGGAKLGFDFFDASGLFF